MNLTNIKKALQVSAIVLLSLIANVSQAADVNMLNKQLMDSLGRLVDAMGKVQSMNGPEVMIKFGNIVKQNPDEDKLKVMGESLKFPPDLKSEFDSAAEQVITQADSLFIESRKANKSECQAQLNSLEPEFNAVKSAIHQAMSYSVAQPIPRAKAYIAVLNALPLNMTVSKISMLSMMTCRT